MVGGTRGLRPDLALEVRARQMRHLSQSLLLVGLILTPVGALALLGGGTVGLLLGIMGLFFGLCLLLAGGVMRFVAGQQDIELAAVMAQMEDEGTLPDPDGGPDGPRYAAVAAERSDEGRP